MPVNLGIPPPPCQGNGAWLRADRSSSVNGLRAAGSAGGVRRPIDLDQRRRRASCAAAARRGSGSSRGSCSSKRSGRTSAPGAPRWRRFQGQRRRGRRSPGLAQAIEGLQRRHAVPGRRRARLVEDSAASVERLLDAARGRSEAPERSAPSALPRRVRRSRASARGRNAGPIFEDRRRRPALRGEIDQPSFGRPSKGDWRGVAVKGVSARMPARPADPGAAGQPHQDRLGLIVHRMGCDEVGGVASAPGRRGARSMGLAGRSCRPASAWGRSRSSPMGDATRGGLRRPPVRLGRLSGGSP